MVDVQLFRRVTGLGRRSSRTPTTGQPTTDAGARCPELASFPLDARPLPGPHGDRLCCEGCTALGERNWAHLRMCLDCGYIGCCDSSPRRHATAHFHESGHPVMRSAEPGESWRWCYVHHVVG
ncbi:UBP-type zinc finger domain-containing protein [Gordonia paraffinivorans]|uniref:UBP-type domain-containing protein n=2 Tax=Gordonia paraffinivorans TaxID=175628 RepID=A0ABQ0IRX5_9ACTN|nr:UBP-type zinc finger domain-containing protein [Gordonia paraffinivorans]GAC86293.1 hypothetical protein GP2_074_00020 [Gordonia paraffinivorans NBRC 108238]VFA88321.1 Zn-finger in ubiquitin-hydrolases and other protein [Gordonia paraffinivorans]